MIGELVKVAVLRRRHEARVAPDLSQTQRRKRLPWLA
jgi:hypothetical protein